MALKFWDKNGTVLLQTEDYDECEIIEDGQFVLV